MFKLKLFKKLTITKKILIWFLIVSLTPVAFIGYVTFKTSEKKIKEETLKTLIAIAESNEASLNKYIIGKEREARELAFTLTIVDITEKYHNAFHIGIDTKDYVELERKHRKYFITYVNKFDYDDLMLADIDGNVFFAVNNEDFFGSNLNNGPYKDAALAKAFRQTIKSGKTGMSDFMEYYPFYKPAAFISTPVIKEGNIIGVLILQLKNEGIYETVQNYIGLGQTGEIVIASIEGNEAVFIAPLRHDPEAAFNRKVILGSKEALPIQRAVQGENGSGLSVDYRNKEILAIWRYLPHFRWGMVTKMDTEEAYKHIYNLRKWTFYIGITTILAVTLIAFAISRSISSPIKALHKGSEIIGSGNLDYKVSTDAKDEIGELSRSLDEMTLKLKTSLISLEDEITIRKRTEEELKLSHKELSEKVAKLEEANTQLDEYASVVSHDIRTPLRAIHNYADFLKEDLAETINGDQKLYLDKLGTAVQQAEELISDLLELSRIGRHTISVETVSVGSYLEKLIESLKLPEEVEIEMMEDWPKIDVEPIMFRQIFQNIIENAVKFNISSHKKVELGWRHVGDGYCEIFISDNGIGIEPRFHEQIFKVFERLHTQKEYDGTGIGLAIVKKAVSKLHGLIRVESKPGKGSTFFVKLPEIQKEIKI